MIVYLLGVVVKSVFVFFIGAVRLLFGEIWVELAAKVSAFVALEGITVGLAFVDLFMGIDFIVWATGLSVLVVITIRVIRLIIGVFSKA